jgi:hypothetical protein
MIMSRSIDIRKVDGQWRAIRDDQNQKFKRGVHLKWVLHPDPDDPKKPISAHFQFTDKDLVENEEENTQLTKDLTAVIPEPGKKLFLKIKGASCRRKNPRYYAIWIADGELPSGGVFAVGEDGNPPPEMDVGGG